VLDLPSCNGKLIARAAFCDNHYRRWKRHGDARGGRQTPGDVLRFFEEVVLSYDGDECLIWPFAKTTKGYAQVVYGGRLRIASRVVCETTRGPAPSDLHQAAHSCGRGRMLASQSVTSHGKRLPIMRPIGSPTETALVGERHPLARLLDADIDTIMSLKGTMLLADIGARFGISATYVGQLHKGRGRGSRGGNS
jgi:hypothetical protein